MHSDAAASVAVAAVSVSVAVDPDPDVAAEHVVVPHPTDWLTLDGDAIQMQF